MDSALSQFKRDRFWGLSTGDVVIGPIDIIILVTYGKLGMAMTYYIGLDVSVEEHLDAQGYDSS